MDCDKCIYYEGKENSHCYMFESCPEFDCECSYYESTTNSVTFDKEKKCHGQ